MPLLLIFLSSFFLLFQTITHGSFRYQKTSRFIKSSHEKMSQRGDNKETVALYSSLITGYKSNQLGTTKIHLQKMSMLHLATPSGLHLNGLIKFFSILKLKPLVLVLLFFLFLLPGFDSLKRVIWFKNINFISHNSPTSFILTFAIDLIWGSFYKNSLSFIFSFLFLGIIVFSKRMFFFYLFLGSIMVNFFLGENTNLLSLLVNTPLSLSISILFPVLAINYFFPHISWLNNCCFWFLELFKSSLAFLYEMSTYFPDLEPSFLIIISIFILLPSKKLWKMLILLNFIFYSSNLENSNFQMKIKNSKYFKIQSRCETQFRGSYWEISC